MVSLLARSGIISSAVGGTASDGAAIAVDAKTESATTPKTRRLEPRRDVDGGCISLEKPVSAGV